MAGVPDIVLADGRVIPGERMAVRTSRASGPGGQNVNKVASKVDLRLDLDAARGVLSEREVARIRTRLVSRIDAQGRLCVVAGDHRTRAANLRAAAARMAALIEMSMARPRPRRRTRPPASYHRARLAQKRQRGQIKRSRRAPFDRDD